jgi:hypothetical protein
MKTLLAASILLLLGSSCGGKPAPEFSPGEMEVITAAAGMVARNLAYAPGSPEWSPAPDEAVTAYLDSLAEGHMQLWPVFFRAAADTASKIEQIMIQRTAEEQQSQLL